MSEIPSVPPGGVTRDPSLAEAAANLGDEEAKSTAGSLTPALRSQPGATDELVPDARPSIGLQLPSNANWVDLSSELKNSLPSGALTDNDAAYLQDASAFLMRLGRVLHAQGTSALRLEEALGNCATRLGVTAHVFSTPTSLFVAVGDERIAQTHMVRVTPGEVNLSKLVELNALIDAISAGNVSLKDAFGQLDILANAKPPYHAALTPLAFGISSAAAARFFRGSLWDVVFAGLLGVTLGCLALWVGEVQARRRVYPAVAAFIASVAAVVAARYLPVADGVSTLSALIVLIPGLTLTVAMSELATQHWMSGTARFAGALVQLLQMALGVALGRELVGRALPNYSPGERVAAPLPDWSEAIALLLAPIAFAVLFRARSRDIPWILGAGLLGFAGARAGASLLGPELGVFVGAFVVAIISNAIARRLHRPASVTLVPGIMLLVPGSIGFRSLSSFMERDVVSGTEGIFRMFLVAATLVGGLLMANAVLPPRREL